MRKRVIKISALLFIGCCIGGTSVIIFDCYDMIKPTFWELKFIDVLHLILYLVIAIYFAYHLQNRFSDQQMKKNVLLRIADDIQTIFEKELPSIEAFMEDPKKGRNKTTLTLRKISNKINIFEVNKDKQGFNKNMAEMVGKIRNDYKQIKRTITDEEFGTDKSFSQESINKMLSYSCNLILHVDQFKSSVFN
jgi:hypothetical protein